MLLQKNIFKIFYYFILICMFIEHIKANDLIGRIHSVTGNVNIHSNIKTNSVRKAIVGRGVYEGDQIITTENGITQIIYDHKKLFIRIESNTTINFSSAGFSDIIDLTNGILFVQKAENERNIKIFTSTGQYDSKNGKFWLSSKLNKLDEILVNYGKIQINNRYSLSDVKLGNGEAAISETSGEIYYGKYQNIELSDLLSYTDKMKNFFDPVFIQKNIPEINSYDLIPQYKKRRPTFVTKVQSFSNYKYQFGVHSAGLNFFQVIPYYHQSNFKISFSLPLIFDSNGFRKSDWDDIFDYLAKINYLDYSNNLINTKIHIGKIEDKTWGAGGLLYKYRNTQNFPVKVRTGIDYSKSYGRNFLNINIFISSIRDLIRENGSLVGLRSELYITEKFPLTIGIGFLADFNCYSELSDNLEYKERSLTARIFDLNYKLSFSQNNFIKFYFEYDELYYNEDISFTSPGISDIEMSGASNWMLGAEFKKESLRGNLSFELSGKTMDSQFFNSLYDIEKARYISIPKDSIQDENSRFNDLNNYSLNYITNSENDSLSQYLIPKDVYAVYSDRLNYYNSPGVNISIERFFEDYFNFKIGYGLKIEKRDNQYFTIYNSETLTDEERINFEYKPKKYHDLEVKMSVGDNLLNYLSGFDFFYNQYNAPSFFSYSNTTTSTEMGFKVSVRPIQFMRIILENKLINFDHDKDGVTDKVYNLNFELKFSL